jgi:hypothetical protein
MPVFRRDGLEFGINRPWSLSRPESIGAVYFIINLTV